MVIKTCLETFDSRKHFFPEYFRLYIFLVIQKVAISNCYRYLPIQSNTNFMVSLICEYLKIINKYKYKSSYLLY